MAARVATTAVLLLGAALGGCGVPPERETAVRATLAAAERAAEERDVAAALALVSADYGDDAGRDRAALRRFLRGWFALNPEVELLVTVEQLEFPDANRARARLRVAALSHGAGLTIDGDRFVVELVDENGTWRMLRAARAPR